jgi:hypothetical protein
MMRSVITTAGFPRRTNLVLNADSPSDTWTESAKGLVISSYLTAVAKPLHTAIDSTATANSLFHDVSLNRFIFTSPYINYLTPIKILDWIIFPVSTPVNQAVTFDTMVKFLRLESIRLQDDPERLAALALAGFKVKDRSEHN